ncbi:unnamed protein product [Schistosoma mattheei]|uniref:Uncharacterized protein n=1 Tax=Schistosoma mattheei TaxID=31246 RepID=A0A183PD59_9TREM|nr:unnamed protein product [Schistosoma mattheei]
MKDFVDTRLRDQQAGFRKDGSCTDQITTLRIILEQPVEWNSSLYINFIGYEKAFDSVDRTTLWKLLRHYGVPQKIVNVIRNSCDGLNCKIVHGGQLTDSSKARLLTLTLSLSPGDRLDHKGKHEIEWTSWMQLDDLDFADDLALLYHTQQMQEKTTSVAAASTAARLNIHKWKSKILRYNTACNNRITFDVKDLEDVKTVTYLSDIIDDPFARHY